MRHSYWARSVLSRPWLIKKSRLSFPIYLVHWPILVGPAALIFLKLNGAIGLELARVGAVVAGISIALAAARLFFPVDRGALSLSVRWRERLSGMTMDPTPQRPTVVAPQAVSAE